MPLKQKWHPLPASYPSVVRRSSGYTTTTYHPGCTLDPINGGDPVDWDETMGPFTGETPVSGMGTGEWIYYSNSKFRSFNPCHHVKQTNDVSGRGIEIYRSIHGNFSMDCASDDYPSGVTTEVNGTDRILFRTDRLLGDSLIPIIVNWDPYLPIGSPLFIEKCALLDRMALDTMIPKLDDGFSLPVFIAELKDLRYMVQEAWECLTKLPTRVRRLFNRPLKGLSQSWLSAVFGWLPFVSDIQTLVTKCWGMDDIVLKYLAQANKRMTLHYQKALSPYTFQDPSWFETDSYIEINAAEDSTYYFAQPVFSLAGFNCKTTRTVSYLKFHATLDYTYNVPAVNTLDMQSAALKAMCMSLGVKPSLADLWELVPFSFVVDWFLKVGPWLKQFDVDLLPAEVVVHDYCRSFRYNLVQDTKVVDLGSFIEPGSSNSTHQDWSVTPSSDVASTDVTSFYRLPGVPAPKEALSPDFRTPRGLQWVSGAALALSRQRKRRRSRR